MEFFYSLINPIEYTRQKNRKVVIELIKEMPLHELIEQMGDPYQLEDGIAEVFLDQIVNRLAYHKMKEKNNSFSKKI